MFTPLVHLLTFIAFTAHALLGCCGHHTHQDSTCVQHAAFHVEQLEYDSDHDHDHESIGREGLIDGLLASWFGCDAPSDMSGEHSHDCDEGSCSFVMPRLVGSLEIVGSFAFIAHERASIVCDFHQFRSSDSSDRQRCSYSIAKSTCAMQQSWQI